MMANAMLINKWEIRDFHAFLPLFFSTNCCPMVLSTLTSQPQKPVHLGIFILARVLSWALHVFQWHLQYKFLWLASCGRDDAVVYLFLKRVRAVEHATALVHWYLQLAPDVQLIASDGRNHGAVQVYTCKRSQCSCPNGECHDCFVSCWVKTFFHFPMI